MKTVLLQCASGSIYEELQREIEPWHRAYCRKHGIDYVCHYGPMQTERSPLWDRSPMILRAFESYDLIVWMDVDALIVDVGVDFREAATEFEDVGMAAHRHRVYHKRECSRSFKEKTTDSHFNNGVMYIRNTEKARQLFQRVEKLGPVMHHPRSHQARVLRVGAELQAITKVDDRWNATESVNESERTVVKAWHGQTRNMAFVPKVRAALQRFV